MYIDTLQNIRIYYVVHVHELIDCTHINPCSGQNRLFLQLEFPQHHPPSCVSDRLLKIDKNCLLNIDGGSCEAIEYSCKSKFFSNYSG